MHRYRHRTLPVALASLVLVTTAAALTASGSSAAPSESQELFEKTLLVDPKTTPAVEQLLTSGGGIVAPEIEFADLTGDDRSNAVVLVQSGGVAGAVALYVFSTDGEAADSDLRAVFRSQRLYGASVEVADATLILRTPRFASGDDVCCPTKLVERVYAWNADSETMRRRSSRERPGPTRRPRAVAAPAKPSTG